MTISDSLEVSFKHQQRTKLLNLESNTLMDADIHTETY